MNSETIIQSQKDELLGSFVGPGKVIKASEKWRQILEERKNKPPFVAKTGLPSLDACLNRIKKSHLIVLSGPPKSGKTSLALTFTKNFVEQGLKCIWFPFEMGHEDILERFDKLFENPKFDFYTPQELVDKDIEWVRERIIETKKKYGEVDAIFIDHLDFLRDRKALMKNVNMNLAAYVGGIAQSVKSLAVETNTIVFLLCHIIKKNWTSNDLPTSENIADARQITDLADYVLMVIRARPPKSSNEVYDGNNAIVGVTENRHGGKTKKFPALLKDEFLYEIDTLNFQPIEPPKESPKEIDASGLFD